MPRLETPLALTLLSLTLPGCKDSGWGERAPFSAEPAPEVWVRPAEVQAAPSDDASAAPAEEERLARRVWGEGSWPCKGHPSCERGSPADGTLGMTIGGYAHIDPSRVSETEGFVVASNLFEGLINPARRSGGPYEMGVAERWTVSADGRVYTFTLRADARWSNGRPVTADDFVYAWRRKLDPATAADGTDALEYIAGAAAFAEGKVKDPETIGVKALDARTLEVTLTCAFPFWPAYLASGAYLPVPREAIEAHDRKWDEPGHIVTNGPYHLAELHERDRLVLVRSETYWDKDNVRIPRAILYIADTEQAGQSLYDAGQVHWARSNLSPGSVAANVKAKRPDMLIDPWLCVYYYMFRVDRAPFTDARVRRAFDLAVDKARLVTHVTQGLQIPADGLVPPSFDETQGYRGPEGEGFDPARARALLAEAGFPGGRGLPPVRLVYNTMETHRLVAEFVGRQLEENLGITVEVANMEWKSLLQTLRAGDFQLARLGACGTDVPLSFLENFKSHSPRNDMGWKNPEFDRLFEEARCGSRSREEILAKTAAAEALLMEGRPVMPLYWYTRGYFRAPVLQGIEVHLEDFHPIKYMWWADVQQPPAPRPMPALEVAPGAP